MRNIVVAYDRERAIGKDNELLWELGQMKADMRYFRGLTLGTTVIMGRKTLESIGVALPRRRNIVVTHSDTLPVAGIEIAHSVEEAFDLAGNDLSINVIGGGQIYSQALPFVDRIHATEADAVIEGTDAFFPSLDPAEWHVIDRMARAADPDNIYNCEFVTYERS